MLEETDVAPDFDIGITGDKIFSPAPPSPSRSKRQRGTAGWGLESGGGEALE